MTGQLTGTGQGSLREDEGENRVTKEGAKCYLYIYLDSMHQGTVQILIF